MKFVKSIVFKLKIFNMSLILEIKKVFYDKKKW